MKTLTKVILVQWYLLEAVDIPIAGNTAIIGENGAGKSAVLDAIQTVLTGANKKLMSLNKGSNEKSRREIWEYVLGVMSDPKKADIDTKIKPREKANCYLALNFHDMETGETTCVGMGIYASLADMCEKVEGYFICPGLSGSKELFLEHGVDDSMSVLPWVRIKERLAKRCPVTRFFQEPGKFTHDLYGSLSEHPGSPNNDKAVIKALQAAFRLEKINDSTDFIRKYMLERDDLQIKELQSALKNYREMAEKADSVSKRIEELTRLEGYCEQVEAARAQHVLAQYVFLNSRIEKFEGDADPLREALADLEEATEQLSKKKLSLDSQQSQMLEALGEKRAELKLCETRVQRERLEFDISQAQQRVSDVTTKVTEVRRLLQRFDRLKDVPVPDLLAKAISTLTKLLPNDEMFSSAMWPTDSEAVDSALNALTTALVQSRQILASRYDTLCADLGHIESRQKKLVDDIKKLQKGKSPLQDSTQNLIQFLKKNGIEAKPLCDLVDVNDEAWRGTIESVLGNIRESLIVIPEQVRKAVFLYRHEGRREFPGCHIVNTTKTEQWKELKQKGTLAECLQSQNVHARAFLNLRLGDIVRVESEKDLLLHKRAATADGMLNSGGTVTELRTVMPILGGGSREQMKESCQRELNELSSKQGNVSKEKDSLGKLNVLLEEFRRLHTEDASFSLTTLVAQRSTIEDEIRELTAKLTDLGKDTREEQLNAELTKLETDLKTVKDKIGELEKDLTETSKKYISNEDQLKTLESQLDSLQEIMRELRNNPLLDSAKASETLDRWRVQFAGDMEEVCRRADKEIRATVESEEENNRKIIQHYTEYHVRYGAEEGDEFRPKGFEEYSETIRQKKSHLVETTLADYREKSVKALKEAEETFRSKFVSRLIGKLETVRMMLVHLNKTLKRHPFHGEEIYKFRANPNPEFKHIYDFAIACSGIESRDVGGLFDPAAKADSPHRRALDDITTALQDPKAAELLQDYRNFLVFDVEMFDIDDIPISDLDNRIRTGSGGENETPCYVAIGASLAAAYRLREEFGRHHGGMSLAVFDEAFSKLGVATCHSCVEFLQNIQLQLLLAAPDEKYSTMAEVMDTIVWVSREGGAVEIEVVFIKPAMRALLRSDNPYRKATGTAEFLHESV